MGLITESLYPMTNLSLSYPCPPNKLLATTFHDIDVIIAISQIIKLNLEEVRIYWISTVCQALH